jgi:hypothetical protein
MTNTTLPPHLEAIGRQLTAAAHDPSRAPRRSRRRAVGLVAVSTTGLAALATAAVLAVGATTATPPAFAVTRHHDGSASLKINRRTSLADVNRKLATMGIEPIGTGPTATTNDMSSIPNCSSIPAGWKGAWVQIVAAPTGTTIFTHSLPPGSWLHIFCLTDNTGPAGSGTPGTTSTTGNTGATSAG